MHNFLSKLVPYPKEQLKLGADFFFFLKVIFNRLTCYCRYDYSGYGRSTGKPTECNTYADIEAAYNCLKEKYGVADEDIILYGQSVGSGPTIDLASRLPNLRAVVLHSPILSGLRVLYPVKRTFWFDIYKNIDKIGLVNCPVLVIHVSFTISFSLSLFSIFIVINSYIGSLMELTLDMIQQ